MAVGWAVSCFIIGIYFFIQLSCRPQAAQMFSSFGILQRICSLNHGKILQDVLASQRTTLIKYTVDGLGNMPQLTQQRASIGVAFTECLVTGLPERKERAAGHAIGRHCWKFSRDAVGTLKRTFLGCQLLNLSLFMVLHCMTNPQPSVHTFPCYILHASSSGIVN